MVSICPFKIISLTESAPYVPAYLTGIFLFFFSLYSVINFSTFPPLASSNVLSGRRVRDDGNLAVERKVHNYTFPQLSFLSRTMLAVTITENVYFFLLEHNFCLYLSLESDHSCDTDPQFEEEDNLGNRQLPNSNEG